MRSLIVTIFLVVIGQGTTSCDPQVSNADERTASNEMKEFITDYYNVMSDRDWIAYEKFFTEEAVLTTI